MPMATCITGRELCRVELNETSEVRGKAMDWKEQPLLEVHQSTTIPRTRGAMALTRLKDPDVCAYISRMHQSQDIIRNGTAALGKRKREGWIIIVEN
jgi:hypothetical protein